MEVPNHLHAGHSHDSVDGKIDHAGAETVDEFGSNARTNDAVELHSVLHIHFARHFLAVLAHFLQGGVVASGDNGGVNVAAEEGLRDGKHFAWEE